eukprot:2182440-Alexandrium_andersonii.AAC.1
MPLHDPFHWLCQPRFPAATTSAPGRGLKSSRAMLRAERARSVTLPSRAPRRVVHPKAQGFKAQQGS